MKSKQFGCGGETDLKGLIGRFREALQGSDQRRNII